MGNECCNEKRKDEDQKQEEVDKHIFDKIGDSFKGVRSLGFKVLEMLFIYFDLARAARNLIPEILLATDILQFLCNLQGFEETAAFFNRDGEHDSKDKDGK